MPTPTSRGNHVMAALAVLAVTSGCTHAAAPAAPASPSRSNLGLPAGVVNATALPTSVPNDATERRNVTLTSCQATDGGWQAAGMALNPSAQRKHYVITVFFTTTGGTVIGSGQATADVDASGQQSWTVMATFHAPADTRCVLAGVG